MASRDVFRLPHSELNGFLFADIGLESDGKELSVLSALARLGHDPWAEASRLGELPWAGAVEELAASIAALPGGCWPLPVARVVATRLVPLLSGPGCPGQLEAAARGGAAGPGWARVRWWLGIGLFCVALAVASAIGLGGLPALGLAGLSGGSHPAGAAQASGGGG